MRLCDGLIIAERKVGFRELVELECRHTVFCSVILRGIFTNVENHKETELIVALFVPEQGQMTGFFFACVCAVLVGLIVPVEICSRDTA